MGSPGTFINRTKRMNRCKRNRHFIKEKGNMFWYILFTPYEVYVTLRSSEFIL
jgi:hypothetical protein